jgi:arabinogalactan endo-1,4-beta-galactosidase
MPSSAEVPTAFSICKRFISCILTIVVILLWTACGGGSSSGGGGGGNGRGGGNGGGGGGKTTTPPAQPTDITPINGEVYYVVNQSTGLQGDLLNNSTTTGDHVIQQTRSFSHLSQRWAFTALAGGAWKISNVFNGFCLDSAGSSGNTWIVQNPCAATASQQWTLSATSNGYYIIANASTGLLVDVVSQVTGAWLDGSALAGNPTQSQQWLLRPAYFRGVDNALLEKQESAHSKNGVPWWNDAGQAQDVLQILRNHGVNMIRLRPSSAPPYSKPSQSGCNGNLCYAETDVQDLDLAKRARNLGMSVELSLLFDGGSSQSLPTAWASDSFAKLQTDLYAYVKQEIMSYRQAGVMPDLVAIGNEVDTGFLGPNNSPTGANFTNFATLQEQGLQAVIDAASDTSIGPAIPPPLTCIHITPAWDLTNFFTLANQNSISYDAICQSYYPIFHGPLTDAQATAANPGNKPVEADVLINAANNLAKPIFIIEAGEHYENGFDANDPWYSPPTMALQRQFLIDLDGVVKSLPSNLGMGIEYWDATGVNVPTASGSYVNGDNKSDAIYVWNGLGLFDDADGSGKTNPAAPNYSALLQGMDALGGKLDPTLTYKLVNRSNGQILAAYQGSNQSGAPINTVADNGNPLVSQAWRITSNGNGFFQIASVQPGPGATTNVLDDSGASNSADNAVLQSVANGSQEQEWDIISAGDGYFNFKDRLSGLVLDLNASGFTVQQTQSGTSQSQQWQIDPVH